MERSPSRASAADRPSRGERTGGPPPSRVRALAGAVIVVLFVLLPALVAGVQIDAPAAPGEWARVELAEGSTAGGSSDVARRFFGLTAQLPPEGSVEERLAAARRAQLLGLIALGGLTYLAVMLARGRLIACLACLGLAMTGPVLGSGYLLRPETPAAVFAGLSLLLLVLMSRLRARRAALQLHATALVAGMTAAISLSTSNGSAAVLLLPGVCMALVTVVLLWRSIQVLRRHLILYPAAAATRRMAPWLLAAMAALVLSALLLPVGLDEGVDVVASERTIGLWGNGPWRVLGVAASGLGALAVAWRVGTALGRRTRLPAEGVLWIAALLGWGLFGPWAPEPARDGLILAGAVGWLAAEGAWSVVWWARLVLGKRLVGSV